MLLHALQLLLLTTYTLARPLGLSKRDDGAAIVWQICPLPPLPPDEPLAAALFTKFQPALIVGDGACLPFPAVHYNGLTLHSNDQLCTDSFKTQVYARGLNGADGPPEFNGLYALMYTWYFPHKQIGNVNDLWIGPQHDWQQYIVWLANPSGGTTIDAFSIAGYAFSGTKGYTKYKGAPPAHAASDPYVLLEYHPQGGARHGNKNFGLDLTDEVGAQQTMVSWDKMPPRAMAALQSTSNFDGNTAPLSDAQFLKHLHAAFP